MYIYIIYIYIIIYIHIIYIIYIYTHHIIYIYINTSYIYIYLHIIYIYTYIIYIYANVYKYKCIQVQMYTSTNVYKYKCICTSRIVYTVYISLYSLPVRKIPLRRSCCAGNHPFGAITMSNCAGRGSGCTKVQHLQQLCVGVKKTV